MCSYYSLLALQAGVVSRHVAVDFAWRLHPLSSTMRQGCRFCGRAAAMPALRNPGLLHMDGVLSLATLPFRCWGALGVGRPDTAGRARWLAKMTRLHAVELGMARSTPLQRGSGALLTLLKSNRRFADAALIGGGFSAHCGTVCFAVASWLAADVWLRNGRGGVRYPAVAAAALGGLCGLVANFLIDAVRTGCDTLAVLCLAEERATTAVDHDRLLPLALLALLRPPPGSAYEMTSIGGVAAAGQAAGGGRSPAVISRSDGDVVISRFGGGPVAAAAAAAAASGSLAAAGSPHTISPHVPGYIGSLPQRPLPGGSSTRMPSAGSGGRPAAAAERGRRSPAREDVPQNPGGGDRTSGPYGFDTFDRGAAAPPPRATSAWGAPSSPSGGAAEPALLNEIAGLLDSSADHRSPTASPTVPGAAPPDDPPAYSPTEATAAAVEADPSVARGRSGSVRDSMAGVCKICMDKDANQVLFPCKHLCLCEDCVEMVRATTPVGQQPPCPICRTPFGRVTSVFVS